MDALGLSGAELRFQDRILAAVDEDPILASDVERLIGLGLVEPEPGEGQERFRRRVLDLLIDQKLRFHEIDRFGFGQVAVGEVEDQYREIASRFPSEEALQARLGELGMDAEGLRQLVSRQLMVLTYVEERLGPRVFVSLDEIRDYYDRELVPALEARGEPVPPIERVREEIRVVLKEQRLNQEIARWTEELRREADVVDYLDSERAELPPVADRRE